MKGGQSRFEVISAVVIVLTAVGMVGMQGYNMTRPVPGARPSADETMEDWREPGESGVWLGPRDAEVVIHEFVDMTCPYCAVSVPKVDSLMTAHPSRVATVIHYFSLGRPLSVPAAVAVECGGEQGRFREMLLTTFAHLDPNVDPLWSDWALEAGVADGDAFESCIARPTESFPRIAAGSAFAESLGVNSTPTTYINGDLNNAREDIIALMATLNAGR